MRSSASLAAAPQLILAKAGAPEATVRDAEERSPLFFAMEGGSKEVVELLLSAFYSRTSLSHLSLSLWL